MATSGKNEDDALLCARELLGCVLCGLEETFPTRRPYYQHMEGNSHAHLKTSCVGPSQTLILENGQLILGIWQDVYFCEFDGPRNRRFFVKILEG